MVPYHFPDQTGFYQGKVRDVYSIKDKLLIMIASDRISAFDVILPRLIPYKGQVLNQIAAYMLKATNDICPNWLLSLLPQCEYWKNAAIPFWLKWSC
jgi:phosphoribosylaminoimidazole-succinocarboxamide synthase